MVAYFPFPLPPHTEGEASGWRERGRAHGLALRKARTGPGGVGRAHSPHEGGEEAPQGRKLLFRQSPTIITLSVATSLYFPAETLSGKLMARVGGGCVLAEPGARAEGGFLLGLLLHSPPSFFFLLSPLPSFSSSLSSFPPHSPPLSSFLPSGAAITGK